MAYTYIFDLLSFQLLIKISEEVFPFYKSGPTQRASISAPVKTAQIHMREKSTFKCLIVLLTKILKIHIQRKHATDMCCESLG